MEPKMNEPRLSNKICPDGMSVEEWQAQLRRESAAEGNFQIEHLDNNRIWGDYLVYSGTGKYKVAFRGVRSDKNYCSCLDFRTNGLGTCKHIESVTMHLAQEVPGYPWANIIYSAPYSSIYVSYKGGRSIKLRIGDNFSQEFEALRREYFDEDNTLPVGRYRELDEICNRAAAIDSSFRCYEDVFEFAKQINEQQDWEDNVQALFPSGMVDTPHASQLPESLRRKVYEYCRKGYGLIVNITDTVIVHEILALAEAICTIEQEHEPLGIILVDDVTRLNYWRALLDQSGLDKLPIQVVIDQQFAKQVYTTSPSSSFVYVDKADNLKEWRNPVSSALKRFKTDHLYMRISNISTLTPVQLSSILQHINPYVLGPFYKFIHQYRPIFPLRNDGSNVPDLLQSFVFFHDRDDITKATKELMRMMPGVLTPGIETNNKKVSDFIAALGQVLEDASAREKLLDLLKRCI
ncbi:MAG: SWIM zinc finger family protein [Porphyromonas sp.]|nr:SWIM zinc finger family protein [Porphyromonas sp.]